MSIWLACIKQLEPTSRVVMRGADEYENLVWDPLYTGTKPTKSACQAIYSTVETTLNTDKNSATRLDEYTKPDGTNGLYAKWAFEQERIDQSHADALTQGDVDQLKTDWYDAVNLIKTNNP